MTLIQLGTFLKIAEAGSFTAAACVLGYAQSTVTTQISQLEKELGCLLFERLGKTVVLTPEGEKLSVCAEKILQLEREIILEVPAAKEPSGTLRLGVSESLCYNRLPRLLMEYKKKYPRMEIQLSFIMHDTFPAQLKKGILDIAYSLNPADEYPGLVMLHDRPETLGFYASPNHPLAKRKQVSEKDLEGVPLLLTSHSCSFRHMLLQDLADVPVVPQIALETGSKEILKQFAANDLGVAFIPDMAAQAEAAQGMLKKLCWTGKAFPVFSRVFIHKDKHVSPAIQGFVDLIPENV